MATADRVPGRSGRRVASATWKAALVLLITAVVAMGISLVPPDSRDLLTRLMVLAVGVVATWVVLRISAPATRSTPERLDRELLQPAPVPTELASLRAVDTTVRMATASAFGVEFRLKPLLRELAGWRLLRSTGIDLDSAPDLAARTLGDPLWRLVQTPEAPERYDAPGISLEALQAGLDRLEQI